MSGAAAGQDRPDVERVFREVWGQAVATLARIFGDIGLAEDAVQDAFVVAADRWAADGLPPNPAGWIITTARHRAIDGLRRTARGRELYEAVAVLDQRHHDAGEWDSDVGPVKDEQLRLMFTAATRRCTRNTRWHSPSGFSVVSAWPRSPGRSW